MPLFSFEGHRPVIAESAWIAPTASIVGNVIVEENASIWFNVVLRADFEAIIVRAGANVQDGSVVHCGAKPAIIGRGATIGHACTIHGATVGDEALIGNGAIVLDGAVIGSRTLVAAGSVVSPNTVLPDGVLALGAPARVRGPLTGRAEEWVATNPEAYRALARRYAAASELIN
jgi:carbonic anhydrase/acetyltransferase-like protein (isoleucine patch superfamily)